MFSPMPREWVKCWFRDCANSAPGAASPRQGNRFEFDGDDAFTLRPGMLEDWQQLVKDCQDLLTSSASFIFGISMHL